MELRHDNPATPTKERRDSIHRALYMLLHHLKVSQPEVAKEAAKLQDEIDARFDEIHRGPAPEAKPRGKGKTETKADEPAAGEQE